MYKILIVDDFVTNGILIKKALDSKKYEIKTLVSGQQALSYIDGGAHVDLIILDLNMPDMDGIETLSKLRERELCKTIPIMFVTGSADRNKVIEGFKKGIDDIVAKPVNSKFLNERVEIALRGETPVQQYKKRNGEDVGGLTSLYGKLAGEFTKSLQVLADAAEDQNLEIDDEGIDGDDGNFGIDFSDIIGESLW